MLLPEYFQVTASNICASSCY